jgi:hypothetical protein
MHGVPVHQYRGVRQAEREGFIVHGESLAHGRGQQAFEGGHGWLWGMGWWGLTLERMDRLAQQGHSLAGGVPGDRDLDNPDVFPGVSGAEELAAGRGISHGRLLRGAVPAG